MSRSPPQDVTDHTRHHPSRPPPTRLPPRGAAESFDYRNPANEHKSASRYDNRYIDSSASRGSHRGDRGDRDNRGYRDEPSRDRRGDYRDEPRRGDYRDEPRRGDYRDEPRRGDYRDDTRRPPTTTRGEETRKAPRHDYRTQPPPTQPPVSQDDLRHTAPTHDDHHYKTSTYDNDSYENSPADVADYKPSSSSRYSTTYETASSSSFSRPNPLSRTAARDTASTTYSRSSTTAPRTTTTTPGGRFTSSHEYERDRGYKDSHAAYDLYESTSTTYPGSSHAKVKYRLPSETFGQKRANLDPKHHPPEMSSHIMYDHTVRPNRPRILHGWDVIGTAEEIEETQQYFSAAAEASQLAQQAQHLQQQQQQQQHHQQQHLQQSQLPGQHGYPPLPPPPPSQYTFSTHDQKKDDDVDEDLLNSLFGPSVIGSSEATGAASTQPHPSRSRMTNDHPTTATNASMGTNINYNQPDGPVSSIARPGCEDIKFHGKYFKPSIFIAGFPPMNSETLQKQLYTIIWDNLAQLTGREHPMDKLPEQAITSIICHPTFAFADFATVYDYECSLSLNGLPTTLVDENGTLHQVSLVIKPAKNLTDFHSTYPPRKYQHPVLQHALQANSVPIGSGNNTTDGGSNNANVNNPECKIYIGNISASVTEAELSGYFSAINGLVNFHFVNIANNAQQQSRQAKIYAFATYSNQQQAEQAIAQLHGFQIGGRSLIVKPTLSSNKDGSGGGVGGGVGNEHFGTGGGEDRNYLANSNQNRVGAVGIPPIEKKLPFLTTDLPSEFLVFYNIASIEEFETDRDDIIFDIVDMCEKQISKIETVKYRVEPQPNREFPDGDVCVFLLCPDAVKASQILHKCHGKTFGPRKVAVEFISSQVWDSIKDVWDRPDE